MNRVFTCLILLCLLFTSCVKNQGVGPGSKKPDSTEVKSSITVVGGSAQADTVGKALVDSIVVKINEPGTRLNKLFVKIFQKTLCNGDTVIERSIKNGGNVSFKWKLSGQPGVQTLDFKVLDSALNVIDSIKVTATAIAPKPGWHVASCTIPDHNYVNSFAMLSTGRLMVSYFSSALPQYSDDNGISWHSFTYNFIAYTEKIIVSPTDEIYIAANNNSVYYSPGFGQPWQFIEIDYHNVEWPHDLALTTAGKLIYTSKGGGIFIRNKKGDLFTKIRGSNSSQSMDLTYMASTENDDHYFIQVSLFVPKLVKLDHTTLNLVNVTGLPVTTASTFYIDDKGVMYVGGFNSLTGMAELHQSKDNGATWSKIFSRAYTASFYDTCLYHFSKQVDGSYYFVIGNEHFKTADFKTFTQINIAVNTYSNQYILAKNNYFIINSFPPVLQYLVQ
ncbi:hypothetical protein [Mucilaginibacter sp.]|uniref:hypothetical protein n=1 Tax=Mucilaginibacter sp. TaxID=1882438 RepID=UPI0032669279